MDGAGPWKYIKMARTLVRGREVTKNVSMRPQRRALPPKPLMERLAVLSIDAPASKRKLGRQSHYGLSNDSSASFATVALSRLAQARDEAILGHLGCGR